MPDLSTRPRRVLFAGVALAALGLTGCAAKTGDAVSAAAQSTSATAAPSSSAAGRSPCCPPPPPAGGVHDDRGGLREGPSRVDGDLLLRTLLGTRDADRQRSPADVFAAASVKTMTTVTDARGFVDAVRRELDGDRGATVESHIAALADLARSGVKVAVCRPTCRAAAAATVLTTAKLNVKADQREADVKSVLTKVENRRGRRGSRLCHRRQGGWFEGERHRHTDRAEHDDDLSDRGADQGAQPGPGASRCRLRPVRRRPRRSSTTPRDSPPRDPGRAGRRPGSRRRGSSAYRPHSARASSLLPLPLALVVRAPWTSLGTPHCRPSATPCASPSSARQVPPGSRSSSASRSPGSRPDRMAGRRPPYVPSSPSPRPAHPSSAVSRPPQSPGPRRDRRPLARCGVRSDPSFTTAGVVVAGTFDRHAVSRSRHGGAFRSVDTGLDEAATTSAPAVGATSLRVTLPLSSPGSSRAPSNVSPRARGVQRDDHLRGQLAWPDDNDAAGGLSPWNAIPTPPSPYHSSCCSSPWFLATLRGAGSPS